MLGNLPCGDSAHTFSAMEDGSDFLIFFRPEDTKEVAAS